MIAKLFFEECLAVAMATNSTITEIEDAVNRARLNRGGREGDTDPIIIIRKRKERAEARSDYSDAVGLRGPLFDNWGLSLRFALVVSNDCLNRIGSGQSKVPNRIE